MPGKPISDDDAFHAERSRYGPLPHELGNPFDHLDEDDRTYLDTLGVEATHTYVTRQPIPVPGFGEWIIDAKFQDVPEAPRLREITIRPARDWAPPPGLTTAILRAVRIGELYQGVLAELQHPRFAPHWDVSPESEFERAPRPGRRGRPDRFYAEWAARYVALVNHPKPVARLAAQYHYSASQIRHFLNQARHRGFLTDPDEKGRAGGELTDEARELLDDTH